MTLIIFKFFVLFCTQIMIVLLLLDICLNYGVCFETKEEKKQIRNKSFLVVKRDITKHVRVLFKKKKKRKRNANYKSTGSFNLVEGRKIIT